MSTATATRKRRSTGRLLLFVVAVVAVAFIALTFFWFVAPPVEDIDTAGPADAVVVFVGDPDRIRTAVELVQRGAADWPIFVRTLHAAAFADAGSAWESAFRAAGLRSSFGGELSADIVVIHFVPLTLTGGVAWTTDRAADRSRAAFYGRIGYAF